ncbi:Trimethyllysine dioxygenase [Phytophthora megakarya]|uniref:trimethyllysine dioxygenase n=1 Tax=Phytophthora megakarya TaxID=4795 RepID=A0A225WPV2_9STRA|nr:Trimethyllysine dioxygenase [Phytophthora megakarya]
MRLQAIRSLLQSNAAVSSALRPRGARGFASALVDKQLDIERVAKVAELAQEQAVRVTFEDGATAKFHKLWLRDHCRCERCMHPDTRQRQLDTASIPMDTPFHRLQVTDDGNVAINWDAPVRGTTCTASEFDAQWLRDHAYALEGGNKEDIETAPYPKSYRQQRLATKELWAGADFQLPTHTYNACVDDIEPLMRDLYAYGLVRVSSTPNTMEATEKFSRKIGFVMRTIYGTMWTTNPTNDDEGYNDTASTNLELLHHTDGTYIRDPPGLQIFNCAAQAGEGGESRYVDSFHVVETLRKEHPEAFRLLSTTPLPYFTVDNDAHLATMEPLIRVDYAGNVVQFRHNDYDRAPLTHLSFEEVGAFYDAHRKLLEIMRRPEMEFCTKLQVGDMLVVDNHRVMHGRHAFQGGDRALIGCYIGQTEYESRLRVLGII